MRKLSPSRGKKTEAHVPGCSHEMFLRIEAYGLLKLLRDFYFMRAVARLLYLREKYPLHGLKNVMQGVLLSFS